MDEVFFLAAPAVPLRLGVPSKTPHTAAPRTVSRHTRSSEKGCGGRIREIGRGNDA
jgi:hypothetical protein